MKITVSARELPTLLDRAPDGIRWLSLDCFDTLLWRNTQAPSDLFAELPVAGGATAPRAAAEATARRHAALHHNRNEVSLEAIHRQLYPLASEAEIAASVERELALEARHCFAFGPTQALIRDAKARGLGVIVVSDTYLSEAQLRALIGAAAGAETLALIDHVFASSEYGTGKTGELFDHVLKALRARPHEILHAGDNPAADQMAPDKLGIASAHLRQFTTIAEQRLRQEAAMGAVIDPTVRSTRPAYQPHRPLLSLAAVEEPIAALGHDVLGPIMHAFAAWLVEEAAEMAERTGRTPKLLFLMRDGYLPLRVFDTAFADSGISAAPIEISRFTATAASLTDADAVRAYLTEELKKGRWAIFAKQLLLPASETPKLPRNGSHQARCDAFRKAVLKPAALRHIVRNSAAMADRMALHLKAAGVEQGDAVMLVDLGYNGRVQNMIEPILRERLGLEVAGRYLLLRERDVRGLDKRGMIDPRHYDFKAVSALCSPVAVLEQFCTVPQGSVVDYDAQGTAMRAEDDVKATQHAVRNAIQSACLAYAATAGDAVERHAASNDAEAWRVMAASALARLLFLPSAEEAAVLASFDHEVNLGSKDKAHFIDAQVCGEGLKRQGLFYLSETDRLYAPGELQGHGLPLSLAYFTSRRFGMDLRRSDFQTGGRRIPVLIADATRHSAIEVDAFPTFDGYYRAVIPAIAGGSMIAVQLGQVCEWVQIESAIFGPIDSSGDIDLGATVLMPDGMEAAAEGLYRCRTPAAILAAQPPVCDPPIPMAFTLIFRPVLWRDQAVTLRAAA